MNRRIEPLSQYTFLTVLTLIVAKNSGTEWGTAAKKKDAKPSGHFFYIKMQKLHMDITLFAIRPCETVFAFTIVPSANAFACSSVQTWSFLAVVSP